MVCRLAATNNLLAPEMAKNNPSAMRTSRMAYPSKSLLPSSVKSINRFQSIWCPPILRGRRLRLHSLDPLSAGYGSNQGVREILRLAGNHVVPELHDAHGVGGLAVIGEDKFGYPQITAADDSPDGKALFVGLTGALTQYVTPAASALARLGVFQHRVLVINAMLGFEIIGIGSGPMLIQSGADLAVSHWGILFVLVWSLHRGALSFDLLGSSKRKSLDTIGYSFTLSVK